MATLAEQGHQEVTEHCPQAYLWFYFNVLWSEPGLIHAELEVDCSVNDGTTKLSHPKHAQ